MNPAMPCDERPFVAWIGRVIQSFPGEAMGSRRDALPFIEVVRVDSPALLMVT